MTNTGDAARAPLNPESQSALDTLQKYSRPLTIAAIVLAAGIGGGWLYVRSAEIKEAKGAEALGLAEQAFATGDTSLTQAELAKVVTRYAGTIAGSQAAMLSAQLYYEAGDAPAGIQQLDVALGKAKSYQRPGLLSLRAAGKGAAGAHAEAATDYESAASAAQFPQERDQYRMEAARQHGLAGNLEAARSIYLAISEREDSAHATEARLRLGEITAKG